MLGINLDGVSVITSRGVCHKNHTHILLKKFLQSVLQQQITVPGIAAGDRSLHITAERQTQ